MSSLDNLTYKCSKLTELINFTEGKCQVNIATGRFQEKDNKQVNKNNKEQTDLVKRVGERLSEHNASSTSRRIRVQVSSIHTNEATGGTHLGHHHRQDGDRKIQGLANLAS